MTAESARHKMKSPAPIGMDTRIQREVPTGFGPMSAYYDETGRKGAEIGMKTNSHH